jgi:hypothetical protein
MKDTMLDRVISAVVSIAIPTIIAISIKVVDVISAGGGGYETDMVDGLVQENDVTNIDMNLE